MNSHCSGTGRSLRGPWKGPVPPKSGCVHINLGFPRDAAVTFLGHSLHAAPLSPLSPCSVAVCPTPTRQGGCACHKISFGLWGCFRKTPGGCWLNRPGPCIFSPWGPQQGLGPHLIGTESPFRGGTHSCSFPSWLFCILLAVDKLW